MSPYKDIRGYLLEQRESIHVNWQKEKKNININNSNDNNKQKYNKKHDKIAINMEGHR